MRQMILGFLITQESVPGVLVRCRSTPGPAKGSSNKYLIVEIDPPILPEVYDTKERLTHLALSPKFSGQALSRPDFWPIHLNVSRATASHLKRSRFRTGEFLDYGILCKTKIEAIRLVPKKYWVRPLRVAKSRQIEAMLNDKVYLLMERFISSPSFVHFRRALTVTREDLLKYFQAKPGADEKYYQKLVDHPIVAAGCMIATEGPGYIVYWAEDRKEYCKKFKTLRAAVIDHLLVSHGRSSPAS